MSEAPEIITGEQSTVTNWAAHFHGVPLLVAAVPVGRVRPATLSRSA